MPWGARLGLLDGGPSHNRPLLGPSESLRDGTPGINPHHMYLPIKLFYTGHHKHPTCFLTLASHIMMLSLIALDACSCVTGSFISR
jgi:hypothetical protein